MTERSRVRTWALAAAGVGVAGGAVFFGAKGFRGGKPGADRAVAATATTKVTAGSSMRDLSKAIARGDGMALAILKNRLEESTKPPQAGIEAKPAVALTEADATDVVDALASIRAGLAKFSPYGRASAVVVASELLHKFDVGPAPANATEALKPASEVFGAGLSDEVAHVRVAALGEAKGFWNWTPQRDMISKEIDYISAWKSDLYALISPRLRDAEPTVRLAAVTCLGALPLNRGAQPAIALLADKDPGVRLQVLLSFADRPALLTEEAMLPLLYDEISDIPPLAERVLKARGLTPELIGLCKLVAHPNPEMRISAIPMLKARTDIDPVVWMIYLSNDDFETVRLKAMEALAGRDVPEARKRLAEMAASDVSPKVRQAAGKLLPDGGSTADALPPLPAGSVGMKLKAN